MIYEILLFLFCIIMIITVFFVSVQKSQGGFFGGPVSSNSTIVFGGSGGSEILQKITWVLGFILIFGSFFLSIYKTRECTKVNYVIKKNEPTKKIENISDLNKDGGSENLNKKNEIEPLSSDLIKKDKI
jgi:protein translocase SecG subunit